MIPVIRWVKTLRELVAGPQADHVAHRKLGRRHCSITIAAPIGIAGSIEPPPMISVCPTRQRDDPAEEHAKEHDER